jgi:predicted metalloprotease with PDZ domain
VRKEDGGVALIDVPEKSAAARAGLKVNDLIQAVIGTMDIPIAKKCSLQIAILIETEQWVITHALKITVVIV